MFHSNMSINVWAEAVNTAVHLRNRIPTKSFMKTPYEYWSGNDVSNRKITDQSVTSIHPWQFTTKA